MQNNKKLVYILPEAATNTHMKYNVEFLASLSKDVEIFLILERGNNNLEEIKKITGVKYIYYTGGGILRIPKLKTFLFLAWMRGYKKVYVHYSFVAAFYASIWPFFETYYWNCGIPWQYKRPFFQELYESSVYKLIDHFVTGAQVLVNKYSNYYGFKSENSLAIPNWIDVESFKNKVSGVNKEEFKRELGIPLDKIVLFFNQRLAERKGAHYIPKILIENPNVFLIVTNDGPYKEKLIETLKRDFVYDRVKMIGRVNNDKVAEILAITDIYILPSEEEGMSHSLMEAFCARVPSVSFDVGGTIDMYPDKYKSFVVSEKNIKIFNEKVKFLIDNKKEADELGLALGEMVKKYDKKIVLDTFISKIFK